jgi:hypothetical protein|tara:strand:+ start:2218 stop:2415 length:198 start_codon:yes stop_codon:yes gene_type:complete
MLSKNEEMKAALFCVVALLAGLLCVILVGCDRLAESEPHYDLIIPDSKYEMHDLSYPLNDMENIT